MNEFNLVRLSRLALCLALLAVVPGRIRAAQDQPAPAANAGVEKVDYAKHVEPLLSAKCYECHGPKKQESGLRLDVKARALKGGDNGRAIVPGKSGESLMIHAVLGSSEAISKMPNEGEALSPNEIEMLRAWIDQGALWPDEAVVAKDNRDHWAFTAPGRPAAPAVKNTDWARNDIDRFVLARLEKEGLAPSPEADKVTLLRRLSLDLIGLPPTIEEVGSFLADSSTDAYEKQVERLLASPHYGERWGRHWLDAARYADSDGFEKDKSRWMHFFRDWVVSAMNLDLPYDQFVIEQLAGDQLESPTQDQLVATGFLRNSMLNEEGGIDPEQFRMEAMFDRMDAIGKSVLGLTIQCAQCHSHKFDPLTQEEYYRMFAFLNNDHESQPVVYSAEEMVTIDRLRARMQSIEEDLKHKYADWQGRMARWEEETTAAEVKWQVLVPETAVEPGGGAKIQVFKDHSMLCNGYAPDEVLVPRCWQERPQASDGDPSGSAARSELAVQWSRALVQGDICAHRGESRGGAGRRS